MLAIETQDDWSAAELTVTVGAWVETWTCPATAISARAAIDDFVGWANDFARGWFGFALFSWSWQRNASDGGAKLVLTNSGGVWDLLPNAAAQTLLGLPAAAAVLTVTGTTSAAGTWAPARDGVVPLRGGREWLRDAGEASGVGAVRRGVPALAPWLAICQAVVEARDAARLTAILATASSPRRAWLRLANVPRASESVVAPGDSTGWRWVALGEVRRSQRTVSLWSVTLDVQGEAV